MPEVRVCIAASYDILGPSPEPMARMDGTCGYVTKGFIPSSYVTRPRLTVFSIPA